MNKYTFTFSDGEDIAFGETQDEAWKSLGYDHSMVGYLKSTVCKPVGFRDIPDMVKVIRDRTKEM